jgi:hypothetical protein
VRSSDDLERVLNAWRPSGPPPELRARIIGARGFSRAVAEWLPAAAALLLVVLFHWLAATERQRIESHVIPVAPIDHAAALLAEFQG